MIGKLKSPQFLMMLMMAAQTLAGACRKALRDNKLTVGEALRLAEETAEVTGIANKVIWKKPEDRENKAK